MLKNGCALLLHRMAWEHVRLRRRRREPWQGWRRRGWREAAFSGLGLALDRRHQPRRRRRWRWGDETLARTCSWSERQRRRRTVRNLRRTEQNAKEHERRDGSCTQQFGQAARPCFAQLRQGTRHRGGRGGNAKSGSLHCPRRGRAGRRLRPARHHRRWNLYPARMPGHPVRRQRVTTRDKQERCVQVVPIGCL